KYNPPFNPPHALKIQSTPRTSPASFTTNVGPTSRIHASSLDSSTTRTASGSMARAFTYCSRDTPTVTGSAVAMALATAANAAWAGFAPIRQLLGRSGHSIQQSACGSNSAGMRKPSRAGVELSSDMMGCCLESFGPPPPPPPPHGGGGGLGPAPATGGKKVQPPHPPRGTAQT